MPAKAKVAVVVDSTVALPPEIAKTTGLFVVPINLAFGKTTYRDDELSLEEFYGMLQDSPYTPTTSAPSPSRYLDSFIDASDKAESVICLTLASHLSASYENAVRAVELAHQQLSNTPIKLLDTQTAAGAQGFIALEAARSAQKGDSLDEVIGKAQTIVSRVRLVALLETLYHVWKSGRVPLVGFWASRILRVKPILELSQGNIRFLSLTRTRRQGARKMMSLLQEESLHGPLHVNIIHANVLTEAEELRDKVIEQIPLIEIFVSEVPKPIAVHSGPGLLGVAFHSNPSWTN